MSRTKLASTLDRTSEIALEGIMSEQRLLLRPKHLSLFNEPGGGGGGGNFDPKSVPAEWLNTQVQNAIAKATGGKGLDGLVNNNKELLSEKQRLKAEYDALQGRLRHRWRHQPSH